MKKLKLTAIAAITLASLPAFAADAPFFTITEISQNPNEFGYRLADKSDVYTTIEQAYDWWSYFDSIPTEIDLSDYHSYATGCFFDRNVCNAFYDSDNENDQRGHSFLKARHENKSYITSKLSYGEDFDMHKGYRKDLGADGTALITGYAENPNRTFESGVRFPAVWSNGERILLENKQGFGQASSQLQTDDGLYLVGGAMTQTQFTAKDYYYYCYDEYSKNSYTNETWHCPGYSNEPHIWVFDPYSNAVKSKLILKHFKPEDLDDELNTADIKSIVKHGDTYFALGHSATKKAGPDSMSIATAWTFKYENGVISDVSDPINPAGIDRPGEDDEHIGATWFVDANSNYAIGNQRYNAANHLAFPVEMFIYDLETKKAVVALENVPFKGATNRAVAINNNNLIVGVSDYRESQNATFNGMPRERDGYIYSIASKDFYSLNDLICTSKSCEIDGKYYFIYNVGDINDNNVIIANAYRYDTNDDWVNFHNAKNVTIMLKSEHFLENGTKIDPSYKVEYNRRKIDYGEGKKGGSGGAVGLLSVLTLAVFAVIRARRTYKKV